LRAKVFLTSRAPRSYPAGATVGASATLSTSTKKPFRLVFFLNFTANSGVDGFLTFKSANPSPRAVVA